MIYDIPQNASMKSNKDEKSIEVKHARQNMMPMARTQEKNGSKTHYKIDLTTDPNMKFSLTQTGGSWYINKKEPKKGRLKQKLRHSSISTNKKVDLSEFERRKRSFMSATPDLLMISNADLCDPMG